MKKNECKDARNNRVTITLSDRELVAIDRYCKKYRAESRAAVIREGAVRFVMGRFMDDYPTIFEKPDLDRLVVFNEVSDNTPDSNG